MRVKQPVTKETIYYPESDGKPMAETDTHRLLMTSLIHVLDAFFREDPLVYVSGNILLYYVEGNPRKSVAPDVLFVRGIKKGIRRTYRVWEEGRAPDVVIELTSASTYQEDLQTKWLLYSQLGVKEYFLYDPLREYLPEPLTAFRLEEGLLQPIPVKEGKVRSDVLGLGLVDTGETLRLYDPVGQRLLPTPEEEVLARQQAEAARERAEAERKAESEERQRLAAELAALREELERLRHNRS